MYIKIVQKCKYFEEYKQIGGESKGYWRPNRTVIDCRCNRKFSKKYFENIS